MLSILIPTYNYNPQPLVDVLNHQASTLGIDYEILVLNDASTMPIELTGCTTINMTKNVGRAKGRNILAARARYPYLLFLDSDSMPANDDFLKLYIDNARPDIVLAGGRIYHPQEGSLLTLYGAKERNPKEMQTYGKNRFPFLSPNFMIDAELFNIVHFDEKLTRYGHEDTIFGIELIRHGIAYSRFDNPVFHEHIESNEDYLQKVELAMKTFRSLYGRYPELLDRPIVRLSNIVPPVKLKFLRRELLSKPSLRLLQLYKLLYLKSLR